MRRQYRTIKFKKEELQLMCCKAKDITKPVMFVGDQGIYLMTHGEKSNNVVYAEGCNPDIDADFYDNKVELYGGDDGVDYLGKPAEMMKLLQHCDKWLYIKMTDQHIKIVTD